MDSTAAFRLSLDECYAAVTTALSVLIMASERALQSERHMPGPNADKMDDTIEHYMTRTAQLRRLREEFETIMNTPNPAGYP